MPEPTSLHTPSLSLSSSIILPTVGLSLVTNGANVIPIPSIGVTPRSPCPRIQQQSRIISSCPILAPTGCTSQFCQSGRRNRPLEPRIGENRSISTVRAEASAFLHEMHDEGLFASEEVFLARLEEVILEIDSGVVTTQIWEDKLEEVETQHVKVEGVSTRGWVQGFQELEWGIRVAWRNSRKCIMRAFYQQLTLVDLRHVSTSRGMVDAIIEYAPAAFNNGKIRPTVFMFPPRTFDGTGPMFLSPQLLGFAGYEQPDGSILGDPQLVQFTKDLIELGWSPPEAKTRWDILPVVAMADGDEPVMGTLPPVLTTLINIQHPNYQQQFKQLDLKWYQFPALARLGFDIGGVQYTASPFIGWWMDAEIAVRDLADTSRYNVLPDVIKAIGWKSNGTDFDELPDHERLLWLSRAQAELNYAVQFSFEKAGVTCTSTLTASNSWTAFDDEHLREKGYRLNADPYWISPPQGSIVPLWHRGGVPNYQPKPFITKHRHDPVKVWKRALSATTNGESTNAILNNSVQTLVNCGQKPTKHNTRVNIYYCGTSGSTMKLAEKLQKLLKSRDNVKLGDFGILNSFQPEKHNPSDTNLFLVATTGTGEVPRNGWQLVKRLSALSKDLKSLKYSVLGIGDSGYHATFNAGSIIVHTAFQASKSNCISPNGVFVVDIAMEKPDHIELNAWLNILGERFDGKPDHSANYPLQQNTYSQQKHMLARYGEATMRFNEEEHQAGRIMLLCLELSEPVYEDMGHIRLIPRNPVEMIERALQLLGVTDRRTSLTLSQNFDDRPPEESVSIVDFLTEFVDLYEQFHDLDWVSTQFNIDHPDLNEKPALQVLEDVFCCAKRPPPDADSLQKILFSMPLLRPRYYSIASSDYNSPYINGNTCSLDLLIRIIPGGRFSHRCISQFKYHGKIKYNLSPNWACQPLLDLDKPLVAVACGTGFGPVRSLIQRRIKQRNDTQYEGRSKMTLSLGYKVEDKAIFESTVKDGEAAGIFDGVYVVLSNEKKLHVQDRFQEIKDVLRQKLVDEGGYMYVCGGIQMVNGVKAKMEIVLGKDTWSFIQNRVIAEVF